MFSFIKINYHWQIFLLHVSSRKLTTGSQKLFIKTFKQFKWEIGKNNLVRKRTRVYEWIWTHRYYTHLGIGRFQISKKGRGLYCIFFFSQITKSTRAIFKVGLKCGLKTRDRNRGMVRICPLILYRIVNRCEFVLLSLYGRVNHRGSRSNFLFLRIVHGFKC
jgi:hypothetical protein